MVLWALGNVVVFAAVAATTAVRNYKQKEKKTSSMFVSKCPWHHMAKGSSSSNNNSNQIDTQKTQEKREEQTDRQRDRSNSGADSKSTK